MQRIFFPKILPRLLWNWKWVGGEASLGIFFCGKSSQNISEPVQIFWRSIPLCMSVYTLLKVVSYYYLSVLSMSVMGFQTKFGWGWVVGVSSIQVYFGFFFNFAKPSSLQKLSYKLHVNNCFRTCNMHCMLVGNLEIRIC